MIASVFVASSVAGPVLGGVFAQHLHWSMIFWINLPLGAAALWSTDRALRRLPLGVPPLWRPDRPRRRLPRHERPHRLDYAGGALIVLATISLLLALSW